MNTSQSNLKLTLQRFFKDVFWSNPNRMFAIKATSVIGLLVIIAIILGKPFFAVTLGLGALAGALSETDDHPKGRIKSMILKIFAFAVSSIAVEILKPYPLIFGIGFFLATVTFILIGGTSERYRGITFGAILISIYTMIGSEISPNWYIQPVLLTSGALIYGIFSLILLIYKPWRLLEEQLANGFLALSAYLKEKAKLFPSDETIQKEVRAKLALLNVQTVEALDRCKEVLNSYSNAVKDENKLKPYLHYFMILQNIHERAASSHERYDLLSNNSANREILEGLGLILNKFSTATQSFAKNLLTGSTYKHPESIDWLIKTVNKLQITHAIQNNHPLALLSSNLSQLNETLQQLNQESSLTFLPKLEKDNRPFFKRITHQLNFNHPHFRYAIRLGIAFLIGYAVSEFFDIAKGEWIVLTVLFVLQPSFSQTKKRFSERTLGTLSGVIIGVTIIRFFTFPGQVLLMLTSAYLFFIWLKKRYAVSVIFITVFVLCAFNIIANKGVDVMLPRLIDTVLGAFISFATIRLLWPEWQYKRLPGLISTAITKNTTYFKSIILEYETAENTSEKDDLAYRIARREAHRADNALVTTWKNMQLDPKKHQVLKKQAFNLTYLNHALLSYLSALGAHKEQTSSLFILNSITVNKIIEALEKSGEILSLKTKQSNNNIDDIIQEINTILISINKESSEPESVLFYNIAEVTEQILHEVKLFEISNKF